MNQIVAHKFPGGRSGDEERDGATSFEVNFKEKFRRGLPRRVEI